MAQPVNVATDLDPGELAAALQRFSAAARRLDAGWAALQERARAIDLELRATNEKLARALAERDRLLEALPLGVLAFAGAEVVWCNAAARALLGATEPAEVRAWAIGEREVEGRRLLVRRAPMDGGGELVLLEDRSRVVELEREVDRLDRLAGLSELALGIAHEIKNPLNGACGFAALLGRATDPETMRRYAQRVAEGLAQVDGIVRDLLAFARPGRAPARLVPLRAALDEAANAAGFRRERLDARGDLDETVEASALVRVLTNLLRNAAEAAGEGVQVTVEARRCVGGGLSIAVRDNGPGVPVELAARLFQPFSSNKPRGHGLGLALAARVLGFLGGRIVLCNPGEPGAEFAITLPPAAREEDRHGAA